MFCKVVFCADKVPLVRSCGLLDADHVGYIYIKSSACVVEIGQNNPTICIECDPVDICVQFIYD